VAHLRSDKKVQKAFKQMDTDGSAEVEFYELLTWWRRQKKTEMLMLEQNLTAGPDEDEQRLQAIWGIADSDSSGFLDKNEVARVFDAMGQKMTPKKFAAAWKGMDADGSGEIEFGELIAWWRKQKKKQRKQACRRTWSGYREWPRVTRAPGPCDRWTRSRQKASRCPRRSPWIFRCTRAGTFARWARTNHHSTPVSYRTEPRARRSAWRAG
jgi:Ca2+-binding EF-hand superfamily protein